jgi:hypothetical protein
VTLPASNWRRTSGVALTELNGEGEVVGGHRHGSAMARMPWTVIHNLKAKIAELESPGLPAGRTDRNRCTTAPS